MIDCCVVRKMASGDLDIPTMNRRLKPRDRKSDNSTEELALNPTIENLIQYEDIIPYPSTYCIISMSF